jgi:hypothetical protein
MLDNLLDTENGVESSISQNKVNNSNLYLDETDSKGIPLLRRIEKYPDLPDTEFIPIEYPGIKEGEYKINKKGEILKLTDNKILNGTITVKNYRQHSFSTKEGNRKSYRTHRLVASTFLENPDPNTYDVVNHIDNDTLNCCLSNLEWVTVTTNNNKGKQKRAQTWTDKSVSTNLLIKFSGNLDDYEWHKHWKYSELYVCKEGFIKKNNRRIGAINKENYLRITYEGKSMGVHRIIMEYILGRDLREGEIVDHINCVRYDNSFDNLKVTDVKGNMNNPLTLEKYYKRVVLTDLYGDFIDYNIAKNLNKIIYKDYDKHCVTNGTQSSKELVNYLFLADRYFCIELGDKETLYKKMENVVYVFNKDKTEILGAFDSGKDASRHFQPSKWTVNERLKDGKLAFDGNYYLRGPEAVKLVLSLGYGTAGDYKPD